MKHNYQIGDWVYDSGRTKYPMQVVAVFGERNGNICDLDLDFEDNEGDVYQRKADEVEPIPITAEILEISGFIRHNREHDLFVWIPKDRECYDNIRFAFSKFALIVEFRNINLWLKDVKYIHQLQQALKLCGINKEIKL